MATEKEKAQAWKNMEPIFQKETKEAYTEWGADSYDKDMAALGYNTPTEGVVKVTSLVPDTSARILDFGCGTGLAGELLKAKGYSNVYGVDPTETFVERSIEKQVYKEARVLEIEPATKICYDDGFFDAVVSVGVFGLNGATQEAFPEVNRILKPGGYFVVATRERNYDPTIQVGLDLPAGYAKFVEEGVWDRLADKKYLYYEENQVPGLVITARKK
ncbi:methyltransferase-like protein 27 [Diadema setosum]|uniref:methyltransferase-like protein 27 n=1 Tax=Diadema setosum TaxID=31175 RepID=UPI003B3BB197